MENFNFGSFAADTTVSSSNYLRPYSIYEDVKFDGVDGPTSGTSASGNEWTRYDVKFSCPEGNYKESIFAPTQKSLERRILTNASGHESEVPSDFERTVEFFKYVIRVYNPTGYDKFISVLPKLSTFEQFIEAFKKCMGNPTTTTKLKLGGSTRSGRTYAAIPNFLAVNSQTKATFIRDQFLGDKVALSAWELNKKKEYESATPTKMTETVKNQPVASDDSNYDILNDL